MKLDPAPEPIDSLHVFIMAGGSGERFWPMSRSGLPKHLLRLLGERTLLETTVRRLEGVVPWERVYVLTNASQAAAVRDELPFLPAGNVLVEPQKRDTAPACAFATAVARSRQRGAICLLLPADAMIHNIPMFQEQVRMAAQTADDRDVIVTFAVPPTHASTAFGYLHLSAHRDGPVADVLRFVEKPDHPTAEEYLRSGQYGWNAGMFAWRAEVFLGEARRQQPDLAAFVEAFPAENPDAFVAERFPGLPKISVDYAVMENAAKVVAIEAAFDWDDVGSWTALPRHLGHDDNGNTFRGLVTAVNTRDSIAVSNGRMIALCGVENLIVIETADAILVCTRDAAQEIKKLQPGLPRELT